MRRWRTGYIPDSWVLNGKDAVRPVTSQVNGNDGVNINDK